MALVVQNPPDNAGDTRDAGTQETQARSLGREDSLEKEMAPHSSVLAWKIPRTEEPGRLQSMGPKSIRCEWAHAYSITSYYTILWGTSLVAQWRICLQFRTPGFDPCVGKIPWRRAWQPTPVFLSGKLHGQRSLAGYSPWGCRVRHDWATNTRKSKIPFYIRDFSILRF